MRVVPTILCLFVAAFSGAGEATYRLVGGDPPMAAAANGFVQEVRSLGDGEFEVRVAATLAPIGAAGTYARIVAENPVEATPQGFELPANLRSQLSGDLGAWEAATRILTWAADHVRVDSDDLGRQDASSVLRRGTGRCSGLANAATALLLTAGFEARTVSGLLVTVDGAIPHRWLECRLPGAGWVPTDPTLGPWAITSSHIVFSDTVTDAPTVHRVKGDERTDLELLTRQGRRLVRPNIGADLVCRLSSPATPVPPLAVLRGQSGEVRRALLDPEAHFSGLLPGRWVLEVEAEGAVIERKAFDLRSGEMNSYAVRLPKAVGAGS